MTPKEKAIELVDKFYKASSMTIAGAGVIQKGIAKDCALLHIEEILKGEHLMRLPLMFFEKVKEEIEKLKP